MCARWCTTSARSSAAAPIWRRLRRTASGALRVEQALTLDQIEALSLPQIEQRLIPAHAAAPAQFL